VRHYHHVDQAGFDVTNEPPVVGTILLLPVRALVVVVVLAYEFPPAVVDLASAVLELLLNALAT